MTKRIEECIIYQDEAIIVCHKPAGLAVQTRDVTEADMESLLKNYRVTQKEEPYVGVIHRLDQPVEGLLVFAKTPGAAAVLSKQLQREQFTKVYYAVVEGRKLPDEDTLEDDIAKDTKHHKAVRARKGSVGAKHARLHFRKLAETENEQLLEIRLETGRFHQIRLQFSCREAPIVGDVKYGAKRTGEPLCLCAGCLTFSHPLTGEAMQFRIRPEGSGFRRFSNETMWQSLV